MSVATADVAPLGPPDRPASRLSSLRVRLDDAFIGLGDWSLFAVRAISGVFSRHLKGRELLRVCVEFGVSSVGVVAITGMFIGMVLAVQAYNQFHMIGLDTSLGAVIHMSVVRELGPVLSAVMLAGRVGTAMAAQLATMRVTEQIDALACLGVDPVKYLVSPRFLGCVLMIPLLTVLADAMGIVGSTVICLKVFHIDSYHYWRHTANFVKLWDLFVGLGKAVVFGGVLSLICCHRGFHSKPGAEGVGRAATEGFVLSFVAILIIDFVLAMFTNALSNMLWPPHAARVA
jgi:phospholipid/cholesterol/gamma-HCH transport system permease protein